jgi:ATP-dependent helicase/nuclease subunit A
MSDSESRTQTNAPAAFAINGQSVDGKAFTDVACDPRRSIAVEACAGAGKTWMLIERMIRALQSGAKSDEILAITFTKKAAGEMRGRLQKRLEEPDLKDLRAQMLASGRSVHITNFHAWFAQLLKAAPLSAFKELDLPLTYELLEDDSALVPELQRAFYAQALATPSLKADFAALIEDFGRSKVDDALGTVLAKRTEFVLTDKEGLLETSVQSAAQLYPDYADALEVNTDKAWLMAKPAEHSQLGLLARCLGKHHTNTIQKWAADLERGLSANDLALVQQSLLTKELAPRKLGKMKLAEFEGLDGEALLLRGQAYVMEMLAVQHQHTCWLYQQRMVRVGRAYLDCFAKLKREQGLVDMADLERAGAWLLSDPERSGAVQERLDMKLRHVMIDEFQDTSPLQWQAMHAWLVSYAGSGGGQSRPSLFIVGDPKQSIYRFRNAEPRVFAAAQAFMQDTFDAALLTCDHTRRCSQGVVDVVNAAIMEAQDADEYAGFRPHTTQKKEAGAALCLPLIERLATPVRSGSSVRPELALGQGSAWRDSFTTPRFDAEESLKEREAHQAARWIAANGAGQSVLVLSRTHEPLGLIQKALQRYGVHAAKQEKNDLADVPAVQDLLALLHFLVSPQSDIDLARALKSPLFGWTDAQLMALRVQQLAALPEKKSWFDVMAGDDKAAVQTKEKLTLWQAWLHRLPPHDALQAIYDDGDVLSKYLAAMPSSIRLSSHAALEAFLWGALQTSGGRFLSAYGFIRAMRANVQSMKAPATAHSQGDDSGAGVQLLTVHGAKGLEADVVLLLSSDPQKRNLQTMTTLIDWQPEDPTPQKFVFLLSESNPPACAKALLAADFKARELEELNALYVAATRAKRTLVVSASEAKNQNPKSVWNRMRSLCTPVVAADAWDVTFQEGLHPSLRSEKTPVRTELVEVISRTPLTLPTVTSASPAEAPTADAQMGSALHRLLQWQSTDAAAVAAAAHEFSLTPAQAKEVQVSAKVMLTGEAAWLWDERHIDWQANEYELFHDGRSLRIDRLVRHRETQTWWVIDFKSAAQPERSQTLRAQLAGYTQAVSDVMSIPKHQIEAAFVTGEGVFVRHPELLE